MPAPGARWPISSARCSWPGARPRRRSPRYPEFYVVTLVGHDAGLQGHGAARRACRRASRTWRAPTWPRAWCVFHQRFSTNTAPRWRLAQPFRLLAHNGEINTIEGNRTGRWRAAQRWSTPRIDFAELQPLVSLNGSDSQSLDNMLEVLLIGGMDRAAGDAHPDTAGDRVAGVQGPGPAPRSTSTTRLSLDPWDGPAGIVLCDGRYAACTLDRNGLRPARWVLTDAPPPDRSPRRPACATARRKTSCAKGKLGPGRDARASTCRPASCCDSEDIDALNRARAPFKRWLKQGVTLPGSPT